MSTADMARTFLGSPVRMLATALGFFVLLVAAPVVLAIVGQPIVALVVLIVGLALLGALVTALLPGRRR